MIALLFANAAALMAPDPGMKIYRALGDYGESSVELFIDPAGEVLDCTVLYSDEPPSRSGRVCKRLVGMTFGNPAKDTVGNPVHSELMLSRVRSGAGIRIPSDFEVLVQRLPGNVERLRSEILVLLDEEGRVGSCQPAEGSEPALAALACTQAEALGFPVRMGSDDHPVSYVTYLSADFIAETNGAETE